MTALEWPIELDVERETETIQSRPHLVVVPPKRVNLFGVEVDALTMSESVDQAEKLLLADKPAHHVCLNAAKVVRIEDDPDLRRIVEHAAMVHIDGTPVAWACRLLGSPVPERIAGIDFLQAMLERAALRGWRVFFLGATDEVVKRAVEVECERHPGLRIAGYRNGFWTAGEEADVVAEVAATKPDLLLLALPTPLKEHFAAEHLEGFRARFVLGVGGSFDISAGLTKRAPRWMQTVGLEWFFRRIQEPRRMWKRYLVGNSRFLALIAALWMRGDQRVPATA